MTKNLFSVCLLLGATAWAQQVTGVTYNPATLSHSQVQISFTSTGWVGVGNPQLRVRIVAAPGTCTSGSGGTVQGDVAPTLTSPSFENVGGLTPSTTYYICPELSVNGSTWSGGVAATVTTLPVPPLHPAPPTPPVAVSSDYPNTSGYAIVNVASNCSNYVSLFTAAIQNRGTTGTILNLPAGVPCTAQMTQYNFPVDPDVNTFQPSAVSRSANTITLPTSVAEGAVIRFGATTYTHIPGSGGNNQAGPIISGMPYYWHVTSGKTGQVYSGAPYSQGGTLCVLTDQGSVGGNGGIAYVAEPRSPNWVIVRTSTPDAQFVPEHSRVQGPPTTDGITPDLYPGQPTQWGPVMANIHTPYSLITSGHPMLEISGGDTNTNPMIANIRFVGIKFDHDIDQNAYMSSDPLPWGGWVATPPEVENIIFDRCWFHNNGTPERINTGFSWNGMNMAMVDTYIDGMHYFHSAMKGLAISGTVGGTSATVAAGSASFGAGRGQLTTAATIHWSGAPTAAGAHRAYIYFTMLGNVLNLAFPPGVAPTVTGASNYHVVSLAGYGTAAGPGMYNSGTASLSFPTTPQPDNYYIDPIVSSSASCSSITTLFANLNTNATPAASSSSSFDLGLEFTNDVAQYLCGLRFFKLAAETPTSHTLNLWSTSGAVLATTATTGETSSGWQSAMFTTPYALAAATQYVVGYHTKNAAATGHLQFQNADYYTATMHVSGAYIDSNGDGNSLDMWPRFTAEPNGYEGPYAGEVAFVDLSSAGVSTNIANTDLQGTYVNINASSEGSQGMIGGLGPGPYKYVDNFLECSGNCWHHDDGGGFWDPGRNDYTYTRDYWHMPAFTWWTGPYSDGNRYETRHFLEWKAGERVAVIGNIFNRWYTDMTPTDEPVEISCKVGQCVSDVLFQSNTMFHGPGGPLMGGAQEANCCQEPAPAARYVLKNNLAWDIDGRYCVQGGGFACPTQGWFLLGPPGEDTVLDHNTVVTNAATSTIPVLIYTGDMDSEGLQVTNNFFVASNDFSLSDGLVSTDSCISDYVGENTACKFPSSFVWARNGFLGSNASQSAIEAAWPGIYQSTNYFLGSSNSLIANPGWFNYNPANPTAGGDFHLAKNYCSGCGQNATDLTDVGANIDALDQDQGRVILTGVPNSSLTSSSATVVFVAPDNAGCSVDYSNSDPTLTNQFTRVSDPGGARVRNIALSGLSTTTLYYYRVNCAVQQPIGQFRTN